MHQVWEAHDCETEVHDVGLIAEFRDRADAIKFCVHSRRPCVAVVGPNGARMILKRDKEGKLNLTIDARKARSYITA